MLCHCSLSIIAITLCLLYLSGLGLSFISSVSTSFSDSDPVSPRVSGIFLSIGVELLLTIRVSAVTPGANHWEGRLRKITETWKITNRHESQTIVFRSWFNLFNWLIISKTNFCSLDYIIAITYLMTDLVGCVWPVRLVGVLEAPKSRPRPQGTWVLPLTGV